jgi:hypothetical protein
MNGLFRFLASIALLFAFQVGVPAAQEHLISRSVTKANFVPGTSSDLFPAPNSQFNGLISSTNGVIPQQSGYFKIIVYPSGYYSGNMAVGDRQVRLNGAFSPDGTSSTYIYRVYYDDCCYGSYAYLLWIVYFVIIPGTDEIQGTIDWLGSGPWRSELLGYRSGPWNNSNPSPFAGKYTVRLPGSADPSVAPPGDGYASLSINAQGVVNMTGALADGKHFSRSGLISTNGYFPFHVATDNGLGIMIGWLTFDPAPARDIFGDLVWIEPSNFNATYYPAGFEGTVPAFGGPYVPPSSTSPALDWTSGFFEASDGNLSAPLANNVTLSPTGKLTNDGGPLANLTFSLNRNTGVFNGRFREPQSGRTRNYSGALFQNENNGGGYFLGVNQGGRIRLEPAPAAAR